MQCKRLMALRAAPPSPLILFPFSSLFVRIAPSPPLWTMDSGRCCPHMLSVLLLFDLIFCHYHRSMGHSLVIASLGSLLVIVPVGLVGYNQVRSLISHRPTCRLTLVLFLPSLSSVLCVTPWPSSVFHP